MTAPAPPRPADALPVPPLRLRRIRLCGVGPDGARFDPLDLDLTTTDGAASRVLLSLTNTGGKSTLITLLSSLVVPASRAQVGGKNLGDYVLTGDTSHVVCEWEDATTGTRTVTGTVMEWKDGRRQPAHKQRSTTNMHRAWYLFRTGPRLPGIDDLPFVVDSRRMVFEKYVALTADLVSRYPQAQWVIVRTQQNWTRMLEERTSVDPVLFGYQMRMNDSEAGAQKLLATFDSSDNVVRFFVAALNDDREVATFTDRLGSYAKLAAGRPELEALRDFCAEVAPRIEHISQKAAAVEAAEAAAVRARVAGGEHTAALTNRVGQDRSTLVDLEQAAEQAAAELVTARREYGQISDIRLQLQLEQARARVGEARQAVQLSTTAAEEAAFEADAWQAVNVVVEVERMRTAGTRHSRHMTPPRPASVPCVIASSRPQLRWPAGSKPSPTRRSTRPRRPSAAPQRPRTWQTRRSTGRKTPTAGTGRPLRNSSESTTNSVPPTRPVPTPSRPDGSEATSIQRRACVGGRKRR